MIYPALDVIKNGRLKGVTTATQCPDVPCDLVKVKALSTNSASIYIGGEELSMLPTGGDDDNDTGYELAPGDESGWLPVSNLKKIYRIGSNVSDQLVYIACRAG